MTDIPTWWQFLLIALAAWRVFYLIGHDEITEKARRYVTRTPKNWDGEREITSKEYRETLALFLQCPYCCGFWLAIVWWLAWWAWPTETVWVAVPFALSAAVVAAHQFLSS